MNIVFKGEIAALIAAFFWAFATIIFGRIGKLISPLQLNLLKGAIAMMLLLLTTILVDPHLPIFHPFGVCILFLSGIIGIGIGDTAYFGCLNCLGPRRALLLWTLAPPLTAIIAFLFLFEELELHAWLGIIITISGIAWVISERQGKAVSEGSGKIIKGTWLGIIAALSQATGAVLSRAGLVYTPISPLWSAIIRLAGGLVIMIALLRIRKQNSTEWLKQCDSTLWVLIFLATFIGTYLGLWLQQISLKFTNAGIAQTLLATSPIFVLPLAAFWLKEKISVRSILGALFALFGVAILFLA